MTVAKDHRARGSDISAARTSPMTRMGDLGLAIKKFESAIANDPNNLDALIGIGSVFEELGDATKAIPFFEKALEVSPDTFHALHRLGRLLVRCEQASKAVNLLERAVQIEPASDAAWNDLGSAQRELGDVETAIDNYIHATKLNPRSGIAFYNLGACYRETRQINLAIDALHQALTLNPDAAQAVCTMANIQSDCGNTEDALKLLDDFLRVHPENAECHQTKALVQLRSGSLKEGFENYEWRLAPTINSVTVRPFSQRRWQGESLTSERLLIWLEQGVGDEILAASMLADIQERAPRCLVECDPRLASLLNRSFPKIEVIPRQDPPASIAVGADVTCPAWSAARFLRADHLDFPSHSSYLKADQSAVAMIRSKLRSIAGDRKIVGFSWASGVKGGQFKTPPLQVWRPLFNRPDLMLLCLQYAPSESDISVLSQLGDTELFCDHDIDLVGDIDSSASYISALDAVITISNSTSHLAGALGVPVGNIIPEGHGGFWYWHRETKDCLWYPSMHLSRQSSPGQWEPAVDDSLKWLDSFFE